MADDVLLSINGNILYKNELDALCSEYIAGLPDPGLIYKTMPFSGMLKYIYNKRIKYILDDDKNIRNTTHNNYSLLNTIFHNVYVPLCNEYNMIPTILSFCVMVNISREYISCINSGVAPRGERVNSGIINEVKSWYQVCESSIYSRAIGENSIGAIFGLKSVHGYQEAAQKVEVVPLGVLADPETIAAKYQQTKVPALPAIESELSENSAAFPVDLPEGSAETRKETAQL